MKPKKACYNESCSSFEDKTKYSSEYSFCPKCASKLSYVCSDKRCYTKLDNPLRRYCDECLAKREQKKARLQDSAVTSAQNAPNVIAGVAGVAATIAGTIPVVIKIAKSLPKK